MKCLKICTVAIGVVFAATNLTTAQQPNQEPENHKQLIVHEWGTFTELQDLTGKSIGGINTDDEPVPKFVHGIGPVLESTVEPFRNAMWFGKGLRRVPKVTTRLETPVVYFYPPTGQDKPMELNIEVQLRGGWLSEFYPKAQFHAPGLSAMNLDRNMAGSLKWNKLQVGNLPVEAETRIPKTDEHVWLAPRKTGAALVQANNARPTEADPNARLIEAEKYLFYRGVGGFSGPLQVVSDLKNNRLTINSRFYEVGAQKPLTVDKAWLVRVQKDGSIAFRTVDGFEAPHDRAAAVANISRAFQKDDHNSANLHELQREMHAALVADGLYDDEATAMLETWRDAYFKSPGLRLFYVVPREWTDDRMPLSVSARCEMERVMIGRIELFSDMHIRLCEDLKKMPNGDPAWLQNLYPWTSKPKNEDKKAQLARKTVERFWLGDNNLAELEEIGAVIPQDYKTYIELGRFRNAVLRHEAMKTGNRQLLTFLRNYRLMTPEIASKYPAGQFRTLSSNKPLGFKPGSE
ncbi:MAG: hypothetical protein AAF394_02060 [Planctomycetota bacterium]